MKSIYILIALSLFSISCTQQVIETDGVSTLESRIATPNTLDEIDPETNYLTAFCSSIKSEVNSFNAAILPYRKNITSPYIPDLMYLNIKTIPAGVTSGSEYIQFFKESDELGVPVTNPNPVVFRFMNSLGQELDTFSTFTQLSNATMQTAIEESGLDMFGYTPALLMRDYEILLTGLDVGYESIRVAFYNASNATPTSQIAALLPAYVANPNKYATLGKSTYLEQLHPMYSRRNSGIEDDSVYKNDIEDICRSN